MAVLGSVNGVVVVSSPTTFDNTVIVRYIRWVGATTAGHKAVITSQGSTVFESVADGANFIDVHPFFDMYHGLDVTTLDSGKLYVYLG